MLPFNEALQLVCSSIKPMEKENVSLPQALNRILAEDIISGIAMPPFNKSAMDGFACRKVDLDNTLDIIGEIAAGTTFRQSIGENQCVRIMTGAMVPEGADFVLMKEHAKEISPLKICRAKESTAANICLTGEDVKVGDIVLFSGKKILPADIAMLASVGHTIPMVYKIPRVAIISTGSELVEPDETPAISQIRNSNGIQLVAQSMQLGILASYLGIVPDDETQLETVISDALENYDVVIISGGVSVGDYDHVPKILQKLEVKTLFHGMNVKPGKHLLFGKRNSTFVFGMPGNPVSSFVQFEILVKPLLYSLMGLTESIKPYYLPLEDTYHRKKSDTLSLIPVSFTEQGTAKPLDYHGSAHIHAYTKAHGIMEMEVGKTELKKGEIVRVRPL